MLQPTTGCRTATKQVYQVVRTLGTEMLRKGCSCCAERVLYTRCRKRFTTICWMYLYAKLLAKQPLATSKILPAVLPAYNSSKWFSATQLVSKKEAYTHFQRVTYAAGCKMRHVLSWWMPPTHRATSDSGSGPTATAT
jgi:hypothetical protein